MRIAILSDIHANLVALETVIADAREHSATHMVCLGDIVGYGPQPLETLARVRELSNGTVLGNHDAAACGLLSPTIFNPFARETAERAALALFEEDKAWLRDLPYIIEGKDLAFTHANFVTPESFEYLEEKQDALASLSAMPNHRILVVGHTHVPCLFVQEEKGGPIRKLPPKDISLRSTCRYVINPGAVGFPRGDHLTADYVVYDTTTHRLLFRSLNYDLAPYRLALVRNGYNPMNYWFLSPSARRRQTEQALLQPATVTHAEDSPFRAPRKTSWHTRVLGFAVVLFSLLTLGAIAFSFISTRTPPPVDIVAHLPETLEIPPFTEWEYAQKGSVSPDGRILTFVPGARSLQSPQIQLPKISPPSATVAYHLKGMEPARTVDPKTGKESLPKTFEARVVFIRDNGRRRTEKKEYKKLDEKEYKVNIPSDAVAIRFEFDFYLNTGFSLTLPTFTFKE